MGVPKHTLLQRASHLSFQEGFCLLDKVWRLSGYRWKQVADIANVSEDIRAQIWRCERRMNRKIASRLKAWLRDEAPSAAPRFISTGDRSKAKF